MSEKTENVAKLQLVHVVQRYGQLVGVYADAQDAFQIQMQYVQKGQLASLTPMPVLYSNEIKK